MLNIYKHKAQSIITGEKCFESDLVQILDCLIKFWMQSDDVFLTEAEARSPFPFLSHQTVERRNEIFSPKQLVSLLILVRDVLDRETVRIDGRLE